jgi:hypothetical protein
MSDLHDLHPLFQEAKNSALDPNKEVSSDAILTRFAQTAPQARVQNLQTVRQWAEVDTSMRKKAQLWGLERKMRQLHERLARVGK